MTNKTLTTKIDRKERLRRRKAARDVQRQMRRLDRAVMKDVGDEFIEDEDKYETSMDFFIAFYDDNNLVIPSKFKNKNTNNKVTRRKNKKRERPRQTLEEFISKADQLVNDHFYGATEDDLDDPQFWIDGL